MTPATTSSDYISVLWFTMIAIRSLWGRRIAAGLISWLVPFLAAFPLYSSTGVLLVDVALFKSVMVVAGSVTAGILLVWYFGQVTTGYAREGVVMGLFLLATNYLLDLIVLVGLMHMPIGDYVMKISIGYLMIPVFCITVGVVAEGANRLAVA
jgi:hypothetical protein